MKKSTERGILAVKNAEGVKIGDVEYDPQYCWYSSYSYLTDFGHDGFGTQSEAIEDVKRLYVDKVRELKRELREATLTLAKYKEL